MLAKSASGAVLVADSRPAWSTSSVPGTLRSAPVSLLQVPDRDSRRFFERYSSRYRSVRCLFACHSASCARKSDQALNTISHRTTLTGAGCFIRRMLGL